MREGKELVERRIAELDRLSDDELRRFEADPVDEIVMAGSGRRFRVQVDASTDGSSEYDDEPELSVIVRATRVGRAGWQRYSASIGRHQSVTMKRFNEAGEATSTWGEWGSLLLVLGFFIGTVGIWIVGAVYLLVLLAGLIF